MIVVLLVLSRSVYSVAHARISGESPTRFRIGRLTAVKVQSKNTEPLGNGLSTACSVLSAERFRLLVALNNAYAVMKRSAVKSKDNSAAYLIQARHSQLSCSYAIHNGLQWFPRHRLRLGLGSHKRFNRNGQSWCWNSTLISSAAWCVICRHPTTPISRLCRQEA